MVDFWDQVKIMNPNALFTQFPNFNTLYLFYFLEFHNNFYMSLIKSFYLLNKTFYFYFGVELFEQDPVKCKNQNVSFCMGPWSKSTTPK